MEPNYLWNLILHFMYSQKAIKFDKISKFDLKLLKAAVCQQNLVEIFPIFLTFSEFFFVLIVRHKYLVKLNIS